MRRFILTLATTLACALAQADNTSDTSPSNDLAPGAPAAPVAPTIAPALIHPAAAPAHGLTMPVAAIDEEVQAAVQRGLGHLLTFWDEAAFREFRHALSRDPDCIMAHWGLVLSVISPHDEYRADKEASLKRLQQALATEQALDSELAYIRALYMLLKEGPRQAAREFETIASRWKSDELAPLMAALLCRDGYDAKGLPREGQKKAIQLLDTAIARNNDLQPAHFLRALLEETNPSVDLDTLTGAMRAVELSPGHAPSHQLLGHLYFRCGHYRSAEEHFAKAAELYNNWQHQSGLTLADNHGYLRAEMYRAASLFCRGEYARAEETARTLATLPVNTARPRAKATVLQLWEVRNLPLRLRLVTDPAPTRDELIATFPPPIKPDGILCARVTDSCLQYGSVLMALADNNSEAVRTHLRNMENLQQILNSSAGDADRQEAVSYWMRALEQNSLFQSITRAAMYPSSADTWYREAIASQTFASLLMPPVLPCPMEWLLARHYLAQQRYDDCVKACDEALERFPNHAAVLATRQQALDMLPQTPEPDILGCDPPHAAVADTYHPFLDPSFDVPWSKLTPDHIKPDITAAIDEARRNIDVICNLDITRPELLTYDNTFAALEKSGERLNLGWARVLHLKALMDGPQLRAAITEVMPDVVNHQSSVALNARLWEVLKTASSQPWVRQLSPHKQRYVSETIAGFRERGADLPDDKKHQLKEIETELSMLTKWYAENVLDATNSWELIVTDAEEIKGLPEAEREAARLDALAKGHGTAKKPAWRFTLQAPSIVPFMKYVESDDMRRRMWEASASVGKKGKDNEPLVKTILKLRDQKAKLLGFSSFADYITSRRMVGSGQDALNFIDRLHDSSLHSYKRDLEELIAYKKQKTGQSDDLLKPWEVDYWIEKRRKELYDFDEKDLSPYFAINRVMKGMTDIFSNLYSITIEEKPVVHLKNGRKRTAKEKNAVEVWHPDVRYYEVRDRATGDHLGSFYTDWFPRESKRAGAWMACQRSGIPPVDGNPREPHLALMAGNLTKPVGKRTALISHKDVKTMFHEFGHLLHQMLSETEVKSLSGIKVAWDFVELPSQISENWIWEREAIDIYGRHHQTGQKLPEELYRKMIAARNYMSGYAVMRQLGIAKLDLELHHHYNKYKDMDIEDADAAILNNYRLPVTVHAPSFARKSTHLFSSPTGYASGYYSYKWAEVLEADAFSRFRKEGIMNPSTGMDFRRAILSQGNGKPAAELYRDFMGRDPRPEALLEKYGITES